MIFDDNLEMSERRGNIMAAKHDEQRENIQSTKDNCHFTLNKYESRPDLMKKTG